MLALNEKYQARCWEGQQWPRHESQISGPTVISVRYAFKKFFWYAAQMARDYMIVTEFYTNLGLLTIALLPYRNKRSIYAIRIKGFPCIVFLLNGTNWRYYYWIASNKLPCRNWCFLEWVIIKRTVFDNNEPLLIYNTSSSGYRIDFPSAQHLPPNHLHDLTKKTSTASKNCTLAFL